MTFYKFLLYYYCSFIILFLVANVKPLLYGVYILNINFTSFGCKVNISELDTFASELTQLGYNITKTTADADIAVVNTCAVTSAAASKCIAHLVKLKKKHPNIHIVTTGCLISDKTVDAEKLPVDKAISNIDKHTLVDVITKLYPIDTLQYEKKDAKLHTRAFLKIQDGCDAFCSYCIIPSLRGAPTSVEINSAYNNFLKLIEQGYKEVVIVGIHIGLYGKGEDYTLYDLLEKICKTEGDFRVRLSSLEVNELDDKLINLIVNNGKICNHLHIPLQSGCDHTLKLMNRKYVSADYVDTINKIRALSPETTFGSDIIVGFPGESDEHFENTRKTLANAGTEFYHVFPYSVREGTVACDMDNHIENTVKTERANTLREDGNKMHSALMAQSVGKTFRVLVERGNKGHAENYLLIHLEGGKFEPNTFVNAKVEKIVDNKLIATVI